MPARMSTEPIATRGSDTSPLTTDSSGVPRLDSVQRPRPSSVLRAQRMAKPMAASTTGQPRSPPNQKPEIQRRTIKPAMTSPIPSAWPRVGIRIVRAGASDAGACSRGARSHVSR